MEASVVVGRCNISKNIFGIRMEKQKNKWVFTWAFKLSKKAAKNEGFDQTKISGVMAIDSKYPGCPHCEARAFYQCGKCKQIVCLKGEEAEVTCPSCGNKGKLIISENFDDIKGGAY